MGVGWDSADGRDGSSELSGRKQSLLGAEFGGHCKNMLLIGAMMRTTSSWSREPERASLREALVGPAKMLRHVYICIVVLSSVLALVKSSGRFIGERGAAGRQFPSNHNYQFVPLLVPRKQLFNLNLVQNPGADLANNRSIYSSLTKILHQLKNQLEKGNVIASARIDDEAKPTTFVLDGELLDKAQANKTSNQTNEAVTTLEVNSQPLNEPPADRDAAKEEVHKADGLGVRQTDASRSESGISSASKRAVKSGSAPKRLTSPKPTLYSPRLIQPSTRSPRVGAPFSTPRRSSASSSRDQDVGPMDDEDEGEEGADGGVNTNFLNDQFLNDHQNEKENGLFRLTTLPSSRTRVSTTPKYSSAKPMPILMAASIGAHNRNQANQPQTKTDALKAGFNQNDNSKALLPRRGYKAIAPHNRPYAQKTLGLNEVPAGGYANPTRVNDFANPLSGNELPELEQIDLNDHSDNDLRDSLTEMDTKSLAESSQADDLGEKWPKLSPQRIHLEQIYQPSSGTTSQSSAYQLQEPHFLTNRRTGRLNSSNRMTTLYGIRDPVTGGTNFHQLTQNQLPASQTYQQQQQHQRQQHQPQPTTIQTQRDLLNQPQTIQITAVPNNGLVNGLANPLVRINALQPNGNLLTNGFNGVWNNGYLDPFGRQVMMVGAERRQIDWNVWIWPLIAVVTLPLLLSALFVPVFLKTIVVLIQVLQSLGLLLPMANALSQHIAQASGSAASLAQAGGGNPIEQVAQKAVEAQVA